MTARLSNTMTARIILHSAPLMRVLVGELRVLVGQMATQLTVAGCGNDSVVFLQQILPIFQHSIDWLDKLIVAVIDEATQSFHNARLRFSNLSGIYHEVRNPLTKLEGYGRMLLGRVCKVV
jgi:signal transduction histidine kinase